MPTWLNVYLPFICQTQINSGRDETLRWQTSIKGWCCRSDWQNQWQSRTTLGLPMLSNVYQDFLFWDSLVNSSTSKGMEEEQRHAPILILHLSEGCKIYTILAKRQGTPEGKVNHFEEIFTLRTCIDFTGDWCEALKLFSLILKIAITLKSSRDKEPVRRLSMWFNRIALLGVMCMYSTAWKSIK